MKIKTSIYNTKSAEKSLTQPKRDFKEKRIPMFGYLIRFQVVYMEVLESP